MTPADQRRWQSAGLKDCRWASWESGEYFLFNPASGKTHLLNELGKTLLETLADTPCDSHELTTLIFARSSEDHPTDLALIEDQLRQLHLIGLVEKTS